MHESGNPLPHNLLILTLPVEIRWPAGRATLRYNPGFLVDVRSGLGEAIPGELHKLGREESKQFNHIVGQFWPKKHVLYAATKTGGPGDDLVLLKHTPLGYFATIVSGPEDPAALQHAAKLIRQHKSPPIGILYVEPPARHMASVEDFARYLELVRPYAFGFIGLPVEEEEFSEEVAAQLEKMAATLRKI